MKKGFFYQAIDFILHYFKPEQSLGLVEIKEKEDISCQTPSIDLAHLNLSPEQIKDLEEKLERMKLGNVINNLIPADDLHWNDYDQKYCAISEQDMDRIILTCHENGTSEEIMQALVQSFVEYKTHHLLFKHFFKKNIGVYRLKNGKPFFEKIKD